jgi:uncharacterized membrane protein YphA (DoxX/SURF4 family)
VEETGAATSLLLRIAVGSLFLAWGLSKLRDIAGFQEAIREYRIVPASVAAVLARGIVLAECATGTLLVLGAGIRYASPIGVALLATFMTGILVNLRRGRRINCGCRAGKDDPISLRHVGRNFILGLGLIAILVLPLHPWSVDARGQSETASVSIGDGLVAVLMAIVLTLAWPLATSGWKIAGLTREEIRWRDSR